MGNVDVTIAVAAHKPYKVPDDPMYLPIQAGAALTESLGHIGDDTGDNISTRNPSFCELTVLYWAWKNLKSDLIGLAHYRRYFGTKAHGSFDDIITGEDLEPYLGKVRLFLPEKQRYVIETLYSHYAHTHYEEHLVLMRRVIERSYPGYLLSCDRVFKQRSGYMFNLMIMERALLDDYCTWMFDILFQLEGQIDMTGLSDYQSRLFGRLSEILFNIWLDHQMETGTIREKEIHRLPVVYVEGIDWERKIGAFLKAKLFGKKYENDDFNRSSRYRIGSG